jgi:hypothetical protein
MVRRIHITVLIASVLLFSSSPGIAADYSFRVAVIVSAKGNIKNLITSYVTRELRSLSDVVIVENNPQWVLAIVAFELRTKGGEKTGVAFSTVVLEPFNNNMLKTLLQEKYKDSGFSLTSNLYKFQAQWLQVGSESDIRSICSGIVADFDGEHLEKRRKLFQQIKELSEKKKQ